MTEETKKEEAAVEAEETKAEAEASKEVEIPAKFKDVVEKIESMTVLELSELVKLLEDKFGVSAQAMMAAAPVAAAAGEAAGGADEDAPKKVELTAVGDQKVQVIKAVKDILGLGLKEAKDMVDGAPVVIKEDVKAEEAEEIKAKLMEAGATVDIK